MSSLLRSRPRDTLRAVDNVTFSMLNALSFCEPAARKLAVQRTAERSADKQTTSPFSKVASTS